MRVFCISKDRHIQKMVTDSAAKGLWSIQLSDNLQSLADIDEIYCPNILLIEVENGIDVDFWKARPNGRALLFFIGDDHVLTESMLTASFEAGADAVLPKKYLSQAVL